MYEIWKSVNSSQKLRNLIQSNTHGPEFSPSVVANKLKVEFCRFEPKWILVTFKSSIEMMTA